uniref:Uncharacterized protein n=1 Tax=Rhizophora mucronata TaxID=61149 RepID=A0A2P2J4W1_RHIMU
MQQSSCMCPDWIHWYIHHYITNKLLYFMLFFIFFIRDCSR